MGRHIGLALAIVVAAGPAWASKIVGNGFYVQQSAPGKCSVVMGSEIEKNDEKLPAR
jgi:hypothetical protein